MKKINFKRLIASLFVGTLLFSSCDSFLDTTPEDLRSPDQIFSTYTSTQSAMFGVYSYIRRYSPADMPGMLSTSDLDVTYKNVGTFNLGIWSASSAQYDKWKDYYQAIREATFFLQNLDLCKDKQLNSDTREQWRAEVKCLRAVFYAQLMRMYGPVILFRDELPDYTATSFSHTRNTWDECVEWVTKELWDLANNSYLPIVQEAGNYARMSQSIALAYRARILLQSASDQFNGNPLYNSVKNADGTRLFPAEKVDEKWTLAREAAQDLIDLNYFALEKVVDKDGVIDPYASYKAVFTVNNNKEIIFSFLEDNGSIDKRLAPNSNGGWGGGINPTQEMVDLYAMKSGKYPINGYNDQNRTSPKIDPTSGYSESGFTTFTHPIEKQSRRTFNMYVNREPRFYVSVLYGGLTWFVPEKASERIFLEMFKNGNNGPDASHNYFSTGYNLAKLAMPGYEAKPTKNVKREVPYIRYAEILLSYAEAAIEEGNLTDPKLFEYWNDVRSRAGLPSIQSVYPDAVDNQDALLDLIRRERRVEFAFEGMSFYDTRRWMIASETEAGDMHGMDINVRGTINSNKYPDEYFKRTLLEKRVFTPSFYLFPIPQSELNKNPNLVQNYKW